jgi:hypothetical protein
MVIFRRRSFRTCFSLVRLSSSRRTVVPSGVRVGCLVGCRTRELLRVVAPFEATFEAFCCPTGSGGCCVDWGSAALAVAGGPSGPDNDEADLIGSDEAGGGPVGPDDVAGVA